jgi:hypothetical protein
LGAFTAKPSLSGDIVVTDKPPGFFESHGNAERRLVGAL